MFPIQTRVIKFLPQSQKTVLGLVTLALAVFFGACTPPDISETKTPTDSTQAGKATLRISNRITIDPDIISLFLYAGNAVDFVNAANPQRVGSVGPGETATFEVPSGSWKIAYQDKAKVLFTMVDAYSGSQEWLRSDFSTDGDYTLILKTDGDRTLWVPSYTTVPAMSP